MMLLTTKAKILVRLERNFSRDFLGPHASGVHVVAVGSPFARWKRALPGIRAAPGLCGEVFGCGRAAPSEFVGICAQKPGQDSQDLQPGSTGPSGRRESLASNWPFLRDAHKAVEYRTPFAVDEG